MPDSQNDNERGARRWRVPRGYAADQLIDREIERAKRAFGGVKSWELTPDGRVIVLPMEAEGASDASGQRDELAEMRARRDARQRNGAGVPNKTAG